MASMAESLQFSSDNPTTLCRTPAANMSEILVQDKHFVHSIASLSPVLDWCCFFYLKKKLFKKKDNDIGGLHVMRIS